MAHFAELDENNIVINVYKVADSDCEDSDGVESDSVGQTFLQGLTGSTNTFKRTSYNSKWGRHYNSEQEDIGEAFRGNYAGIGFTYDSAKDVFIPPQNYPSWVLSSETHDWVPPVPDPTNDANRYHWDEEAYQQDNTKGWRIVIPA
jgi:hypothetical protein